MRYLDWLCTLHVRKNNIMFFFLLCPQVDEWRGRASRFLSLCEDIAQLHCSVVGGNNRAVLYDLYPYVWDLRNTALVAKAFICWLGKDRSNILLYYQCDALDSALV